MECRKGARKKRRDIFGLTPGRVAEATAFAGTSGLSNAVMHVDWNQAAIDTDAVTREGNVPGDYVQWDPREFFYLHDWNVVDVPDGFDYGLVLTAQKMAAGMDNGQPTAIVYRTTKGWQYGIEGRKSHGAGHAMCSDEFRETQRPIFSSSRIKTPSMTSISSPSSRTRGSKGILSAIFHVPVGPFREFVSLVAVFVTVKTRCYSRMLRILLISSSKIALNSSLAVSVAD